MSELALYSSYTLPSQIGNAGRQLITDGVNLGWGGPISNLNTTITADDKYKLVKSELERLLTTEIKLLEAHCYNEYKHGKVDSGDGKKQIRHTEREKMTLSTPKFYNTNMSTDTYKHYQELWGRTPFIQMYPDTRSIVVKPVKFHVDLPP